MKKSKTEITYLIIMIGILFITIILDIRSNLSCLISTSIAITIVQIQATISTLAIALLAIISGNSQQSYLGITFGDYVLRKRPAIFKQTRIITTSLFFVCASIISLITKHYCFIIAFLLETCFLVHLSAHDILYIFSKGKNLENDIEVYLRAEIKNNSKDKITSLFKAFCDEWMQSISQQANGRYEKYKDIFFLFFMDLAFIDNNRALLLDNCSQLSRALLKDPFTFKRGIKFVSECYSSIRRSYHDDPNKCTNSIHSSFSLFSNIYGNLAYIIPQIPISTFEDAVNWDDLSIIILNSASFESMNFELIEAPADVEAIKRWGGLCGYYYSTNTSTNREYWGRPFYSLGLLGLPLYESESETQLYNSTIMHRNLNFVLEYTINNSDGLSFLEEFVYRRGLSKLHSFQCKEEALLAILIHCYLYYLAYYETTACVSSQVKNACKNFLENTNNKEIYQSFLIMVLENDAALLGYDTQISFSIFNENFKATIHNMLDGYELFPKDGSAKYCVLDNAIDDYVCFLTLYFADLINKPKLLDYVVTKDNASSLYINYIRDKNRLIDLKQFYRTIISNEEQIESRVNNAYLTLVSVIKERYKEAQVEHYEHISGSTTPEGIKEELNCLKEEISLAVSAKFEKIMCKTEVPGTHYKLVNLTFPSDMGIQHALNGHYDLIFQSIFRVIIGNVRKCQGLSIKHREAFDDEKLSIVLSSNDYDTIIGSEYNLHPSDYKNYDTIKRLIDEHTCCTTGAKLETLLINKDLFAVKIDGITIDFQKLTINDVDYNYDDASKQYTYEMSSGMPISFCKNEFENFIENAWCRIIIGADINCIFNDLTSGLLILPTNNHIH